MANEISGRLWLVRHARTPLNAAGVLRGHLDPPLDDVGRAEAAALADALAAMWGERPPARVVCSPLLRARQTAEAIAARAGATASVDEALIDRDYGRWAGTSPAELESRWGSVDAAPGVESAEAVRERAGRALDAQRRYLDGRPVVMVAHDVVNRLLLAALDPKLGAAQTIPQPTACWNELCGAGGGWQVLAVGCTARPTVRTPPDQDGG